jgi:hypothetical protein
MGLSDIAEGLAVTEEQDERGVAAVDRTAESLADGLAPYAEALPCTPAAAATVVETYAAGESVADAGRAAAVAPMTAAKTLHLLGEPVGRAGPSARAVVEDWLDGRLPRSEAQPLADLDDAEFALAAYVATHDPIEGAREVVAGTLEPGSPAGTALDGGP